MKKKKRKIDDKKYDKKKLGVESSLLDFIGLNSTLWYLLKKSNN